jgi:hypothetical protein
MGDKITAVDWLYNNLKSHFEYDGDLLEVIQYSFEQAKQMEMEQKVESYKNGYANGQTDAFSN